MRARPVLRAPFARPARWARPPPPGRLAPGEHAAIWLLALVVIGQFIPWGSNTVLLASGAAAADVACAILVLALLGPAAPQAFWPKLIVPGSLFLAAFAWGALGLTGGAAGGWPGPLRLAAGATTASLTPDLTVVELAKLAGAGAIVLAAALVGTRRRRLEAAVAVLLALGSAYVLLGLALYRSHPFEVFGMAKGAHQWRFTGTLLNGNAAGCAFAVLLALSADGVRTAITRIAEAPSGLKTALAHRLILRGAQLFVFAAACAMTASRATLACAAVTVVAIAAWPRGRQARSSGKDRRLGGAAWAGAGLLAVLALGLVGAVLLSGSQTLARTDDWRAGVAHRADAYALLAAKTGDAAARGYGLGAFADVNLHGLDASQADTVWNFRAAHDAGLQAALEAGLPFLVLIGAALGAILVQAARTSPASSAWPLRRGLFVASAVVLACSAVDIALNVPAVAALAMTVVGFLHGGSCPPSSPGPADDVARERLEAGEFRSRRPSAA